MTKKQPPADTVALSQHLFFSDGYVGVLGKEYSLNSGPARRSFDLGYILNKLEYAQDGRPKFTARPGTFDLLLWKPNAAQFLAVQATGLTGTSPRCLKASQNRFLRAWTYNPGFRFVVIGWHRWPQFVEGGVFGYRYRCREWSAKTQSWDSSSGILEIAGKRKKDQRSLFEAWKT